jgi:type IV secretory pathway VirB2 component (pilin)
MFKKVMNWFQGRHTAFVAVSVVVGCAMAWFGKLDGNLVTLLLGQQSLILAHSVKEDIFVSKQS